MMKWRHFKIWKVKDKLHCNIRMFCKNTFILGTEGEIVIIHSEYSNVAQINF